MCTTINIIHISKVHNIKEAKNISEIILKLKIKIVNNLKLRRSRRLKCRKYPWEMKLDEFQKQNNHSPKMKTGYVRCGRTFTEFSNVYGNDTNILNGIGWTLEYKNIFNRGWAFKLKIKCIFFYLFSYYYYPYSRRRPEGAWTPPLPSVCGVCVYNTNCCWTIAVNSYSYLYYTIVYNLSCSFSRLTMRVSSPTFHSVPFFHPYLCYRWTRDSWPAGMLYSRIIPVHCAAAGSRETCISQFTLLDETRGDEGGERIKC